MMLTLMIGNEKHPCRVNRTSRKKSIGIEVSPYRGIVVHAPRMLHDLRIKELLEGNVGWIKRRLELLQATHLKLRSFSHGDRFLFLGDWLPLEIIPDERKAARVARHDGHLVVTLPRQIERREQAAAVKAGLTRWYSKQAATILNERVASCAPLVGVDLPPVRINSAKKRWGSCGAQGRLNFPWRLVMAPLALVDYVVVHELCHLKRRDHSAAFWKLVAAVLPDYRERRQRLREEGPFFDL